MSDFFFFFKLSRGIGTETWFIEVCAYVSKEKLDVIVNLLFCVRTPF